jgi:flagellar biosynthesis protein FliR
VAGVASFYMMLWLVGALVLPDNTPASIRLLLSLAAAVLVGRYVWNSTSQTSAGFASAVVTGGLMIGGIGFCAGFFGPIIFAPQANQGPLLGIFITGPLGFFVGGVGGGIYWRSKQQSTSVRR